MDLLESFRTAWKALTTNKMRSFLTMLGVIIGVFAVITLVGMGEGAKVFVNEQFASFGTGVTYMEIHAGKRGEPPALSMMQYEITVEDARAIERECSSVRYVDPRSVQSGYIKYGKKEHYTPFVMGLTHIYPLIVTHKVGRGEFFNAGDMAAHRKVCVLGKAVSEDLFGNFDPLGEKVKIKSGKFTVIGIMEEKGAIFGFDMDDLVLLPLTAAQDVFGSKKILEIGVVAKSEKLVEEAKAEIKRVLIKRHGEEDFRVDSQEEMLAIMNTIMGALTGIVGGIAAISLLVGGIGIMNIMLVSVTERTREIGIRKAVGAKRRDIFLQFLVESVVISFLGGLGGIVLGVTVTILILKYLNMSLIVAWWAVILACTVSIAVGVFSGVYPAMRAAKLDPVEALRYE